MTTSAATAYCFQVDDTSYVFRDIARQNYRSLFDSPFLKMFLDWNKRYGTRFTLNVYYRTEDGFTLSQFPDRYKQEWADNAGWLRLAFHADADKPDYPYRGDENGVAFTHDLDRVKTEIDRFAGEAAWAPLSIVHWVSLPHSAWPKAQARGVTALGGLFAPTYPADLRFHLPKPAVDTIMRTGTYRDPETGLILFDVALVCNNTPPEKAAPVLDAWTQRCPTARLVPMWTHEQYFWDFYTRYLPDHPARVERGLQWAAERNLKPVFLHDYPWDNPG